MPKKQLKPQHEEGFKIIMRPIDELIEAEYNPRQLSEDQFKQISDSLSRFGFVDPVIVNTHKARKNIIVGGHQRCKVAKALGFKEVPTIQVDLTQDKERELNIRLNKNTGDWDWDLLANHFDTEELQDWGFSPEEMHLSAETEGLTDPDSAPEPPECPTTRPGDLYKLGAHRLLCGDSTASQDVSRLMDGNKPSLMITDPPYGVNYDPKWRDEAERANGKSIGARALGQVQNDDQTDWSAAWKLSPAAVAYIWHAGRFCKEAAESLSLADYEIRAQIIWAKNNIVISRGHYHWKHEPCWYAVKKGKASNWIGDRKQSTLWEIDKPLKSETGHGTQKPVKCMSCPIKNHSGDVYDPFGGSGSTLIAAQQTNRTCYMMEIDPVYCDVIVKRWEDFTGNKATLLNKEALVS